MVGATKIAIIIVPQVQQEMTEKIFPCIEFYNLSTFNPESVTSMRIAECKLLVLQGKQKNLSFTHPLSGYFFGRCGIKNLCSVP